MNKVTLTAAYIKELAELVGFEVKDVNIDDWLQDGSEVTLTQFDEPTAIKDEEGEIAGYWTMVATFDDAPENGACTLGPSTPPKGVAQVLQPDAVT